MHRDSQDSLTSDRASLSGRSTGSGRTRAGSEASTKTARRASGSGAPISISEGRNLSQGGEQSGIEASGRVGREDGERKRLKLDSGDGEGVPEDSSQTTGQAAVSPVKRKDSWWGKQKAVEPRDTSSPTTTLSSSPTQLSTTPVPDSTTSIPEDESATSSQQHSRRSPSVSTSPQPERSSQNSHAPPLSVQRSRKTSWFGAAGGSSTDPPPTVAPPPTVPETTTSDPVTPAASGSAVTTAQGPTESTMEAASAQVEAGSGGKVEKPRLQGKGWLETLSGGYGGGSRSGNAATVVGSGEAVIASEEEGERVVETTQKEGDNQEGEDAGTVKASDRETLVPGSRPPRAGPPPSSIQRSSWWGWGGAAADPSPTAVSESREPMDIDDPSPSVVPSSSSTRDQVQQESEMSSSISSAGTTSTLSLSSAAPAAQRSWMQTLWGAPPPAPPAAVPEAAAESTEDPTTPMSPAARSQKFEAEPTSPQLDSTPQHPTGVAAALKQKASWALFPSSRRSSSSLLESLQPLDTSSSGVTLSTSPSGAASTRDVASLKAHSMLSKSPLTPLQQAAYNNGTPWSSRPSSITSSAPSSPQLGSSEAPSGSFASGSGSGAPPPPKPLTGSIRPSSLRKSASSQKLTAHIESDPPWQNLVLPTFTDTFSRPPRSFPPRYGGGGVGGDEPAGIVGKAVKGLTSYIWSSGPLSPKEEQKAFVGVGIGGAGGGVKEEPMKVTVDPAERLPKSYDVMGEEEGTRLSGVRRVVTIGVHGWFPTPMVRSVLGEPTGTSVKFATMMHDAVQTYLEAHDISSFNIQAIALEGEGQVDVRVEKLYARLTEQEVWMESLRKADVVFLATHSQGSVVSTMLLEKMVKDGLVDGRKTHMLAMCGIAQGPFVYLNQSYTLSPYFNYIETPAARELFQFEDPESAVSKKFLASLQFILSSGVKATIVGSINDQVTPLYSSLFAGISHPALLRAVYIDSAAFRTSDFLANLIVFACRLRNAGLGDHDLIFHVSEALAGALTGVGHSKIYEEEEVFNLAVKYHFETTALAEAPSFLPAVVPSEPMEMSFSPRDRRNPYLLTWALRGIVEDPQIKELFNNELMALREAFETWRPTTKVLRDVRLKLEGIRMLPRAKKEGKL